MSAYSEKVTPVSGDRITLVRHHPSSRMTSSLHLYIIYCLLALHACWSVTSYLHLRGDVTRLMTSGGYDAGRLQSSSASVRGGPDNSILDRLLEVLYGGSRAREAGRSSGMEMESRQLADRRQVLNGAEKAAQLSAAGTLRFSAAATGENQQRYEGPTSGFPSSGAALHESKRTLTHNASLHPEEELSEHRTSRVDRSTLSGTVSSDNEPIQISRLLVGGRHRRDVSSGRTNTAGRQQSRGAQAETQSTDGQSAAESGEVMTAGQVQRRERTTMINGTARLDRNKRNQQQQQQNRRCRQCTGAESSQAPQMGRAIHMHAADSSSQYQTPPLVSFNSTSRKDTIYRFWKKASWVSNETDEVFSLNDVTGHVTVKQSGLYMIYAQMVYHDLTGRWSFGVYIDGQEKMKCLTSEQLRDVGTLHPTSHGVYHQCYTAAAAYIHQFQAIHVRCMYGMRTILTQPEFTFWGIVKIA